MQEPRPADVWCKQRPVSLVLTRLVTVTSDFSVLVGFTDCAYFYKWIFYSTALALSLRALA